MEDKPRYSRATDLVELMLLMLARHNGITLLDIQENLGVSRRTAERLRDCLLTAVPNIEELETDGRIKRWGFKRFSYREFIGFTAEEITTLENLRNSCDKVSSKTVQDIVTKIKALNSQKIESLEADVELLLRSEGIAVRQNPKYQIDFHILSIIRQAIKENRKLTAIYNNKSKTFSPLGIIYGEKVFLVAVEEDKGTSAFTYLLHQIKNVKLLNETFETKDFDIKEYAKQSFGVYQGEVYDVKLKFSPKVKDDVLNYNFHPTQKIKENEDGTVNVRFKASGSLHIIWHLFKWGKNVEILAPKSLKDEYKKYLEEILKGM